MSIENTSPTSIRVEMPGDEWYELWRALQSAKSPLVEFTPDTLVLTRRAYDVVQETIKHSLRILEAYINELVLADFIERYKAESHD